jgi:protein AATF/BFR2
MLEDDDFDPTGGALARSPADDDSDAGASDSGSPGASEDDGVFRPTREDVAAEREGTERKLRMRASIAQDDAEYVGKSSSRRAMERAWAGDEEEEEEEDDESDDDDDESEGGDDDDDDDDEESDEGDDDDDDGEGGEPSGARLAASARDSEEEGNDVAAPLGARPNRGSPDVDARGSESESEPESIPAASDSEDASLRAELASFRAEEAEAARLARAKSKNVAKGVAVRRQNDAWARALRTRIVLQKSVGVVAKFPTPRYHAAMRSEDDDVAPAMEEAARAAKAALAVLGTLQAALLDANPAVDEAREEEEDPDPSDPRTKKRRRDSATAAFARRNVRAGSSADDVWAALDATYARFAAFRDRSCDRWHRKANVQTGKASSSGGGDAARGAFDRALSEQVASAMRPPDRLLARSRPPAHLAPRRLGEPKVGTLPGTHDAGDGDEKVAGEDAPPDARDRNDARRVEELYDDADFYEQSLKVFLESRGGGGGAAGLAAHAARPKKRRKAVDRRASKGRKLRYHVQQPLVNFVAPVEKEVPAWAEKLFQRLFADD